MSSVMSKHVDNCSELSYTEVEQLSCGGAMADNSSIEWTQATWNPVTGCSKVSPGCQHCYAERMARRLQAMGNPRYARGFAVTLHHDLIELPLRWRQPRVIFVNSMSDLFHKAVPLPFIQSVFAAMQAAHWHVFQVLTKRAERLVELAPLLPWPDNVWMGVSIERQDCAWRAECLRCVPSAVRFLSCEPLLGPLQLDLTGIQWLIVGGESGPSARSMDLTWVRSLRDQCWAARIPFFLKQLGGAVDKRGKDRALLDGRLWHEMPHISAKARAAERRLVYVDG
jgi:protein gp37